jgi:hypothetical protein
MSNFLKVHSPLLRFFLLGLTLWLADYYLAWQDSYRIEGPGEAALTASYADWSRRYGSPPDTQQLANIHKRELTERILFTEALRYKLHLSDPVVRQHLLMSATFLGIEGSDSEKISTALSLNLHKNDTLIRQVLVQRMEIIGRELAYPITTITEAELQTRYGESVDRWTLEPRIAISYIYFSKDQGDKALISIRIRSTQNQLTEESITDDQAFALGDYFMLGNKQPLMGLTKLRGLFGNAFAQSLATAVKSGHTQEDRQNIWFGPLDSAYGFHLVKITGFEEASYRNFSDVKNILENDYIRDSENEALRKYIAKLVNKYEVTKP